MMCVQSRMGDEESALVVYEAANVQNKNKKREKQSRRQWTAVDVLLVQVFFC